MLGQFQNLERTKGKVDPATRVVQAVVHPVSGPVGRMLDAGGTFWAGFRSGPRLKAENDSLRERLAASKLYLDTQDDLQNRIAAQRALLDLPVVGRVKVYADVIGYYPQDGRITISVGRNKGIQERMAVVSGSGLLGLVSTVSETTAQVTLITSPTIKIGAIVGKGEKITAGLLKGETPLRLVMDVLEGDALEVGDVVTTSGFGELIPRGIEIGTVTQTIVDQDFGTNKAFIVPSARPSASVEVAVLK